MNKRIAFLAFSALFLIALNSCKNGNQSASDPAAQTPPVSAAEEVKKNLPTPGEAPPSDAVRFADETNPSFSPEVKEKQYRGILTGKWVNASDTDIRIEFTETEMFKYQGNQLVSSSPYSISMDCKNEVCAATGSQASSGWCFTTESECCVVTTVDLMRLRYGILGSSETFAYQKVQE